MLKLIKNAEIYAPKYLGRKDILIAGEKIAAIEDNLDEFSKHATVVWDANGKIITPGLIDQHIHIIGAGGKDGFASMTPEVTLSELIACGTTTVVGLLGTDGTVRNIKTLYGKAKALEQEGISAYMFCGYYGVDSVTITDSIQGDMICIDKVIGCKIAISDIRSSYPTATELLRKLRDVRVGGSIGNKKGILHIHLGNLETKMDILFELVNKYQFPIEHISPTHVGRTKPLFEQAIEFAKLGGCIDITTGASKYTDPYKSVLYALEKGASIDNITFSSDGHAGLTKLDENGNNIGFKKAPIEQNLYEVIQLIKKGGINIEEAFKIITTNPARNLGLKEKGKIEVGFDADLCAFDADFKLQDVFARGQQIMVDAKIIGKGSFES
ncbi:beta-aspartyl-peptidase [uncultured Flavobacterium sp.]|uniref:beta-aspartyl-peptidase n=1 Tax=uncultured Flavobacterium sp. TaxID=165435 RepID=UPI0030ED0CE3